MDKLDKIISEMTLDEKASALCLDMYIAKTAENGRLGIDGLEFEFAAHGLSKCDSDTGERSAATCFPEASALGRSWNKDCIRQTAQTIAEEAREQNICAVFAPQLNISRSLRDADGCNCFSEDPFLSAELGISFAEGLQTRGIGVCVSYFGAAAKGKNPMLADHAVDERALREIYLYAFEQVVVKCRPWGVMMTNNKLRGSFTYENKNLITELLRREWGFDGLVFSDACSVTDEPKSILAGLDIFVSSVKNWDARRIADAVRSGALDESAVDESVKRLFETILKAKQARKIRSICDYAANHFAAKMIADECAVLLKNENGALPLRKDEKIAVIGSDLIMQHTGRDSVRAAYESDFPAEMSRINAGTCFAAGYSDDMQANAQLRYEALEACKTADKIVFTAHAQNSAGVDNARHAAFPEQQLALLSDIAQLNKPIILVITGDPVPMSGIKTAAILLCGYLGQVGGRSVCDVLYGKVNPSGKLAETIPLHEKDMPVNLYRDKNGDTVYYPESIYVGYRYYTKAKKETAYPFGYGLSYTSFEYSNMKVGIENQNHIVSVDVKNTGNTAGKETVQVYVHDCDPKVFKADWELKGFEKVRLEPDETKTVTIKLNTESFMFFDTAVHAWNASPGRYEIGVGSSSAHILFKKTVDIFCGSVTQPVHDAKDFPHYDNIARETFTVPCMEYETLLGYKIKQADAGPFCMQTTLGQIKSTKIGKTIRSLMLDAIGNNPFKFEMDDVPLEKAVLLSRGAFSPEMAAAAVSILNGDENARKTFKAACAANKKNL